MRKKYYTARSSGLSSSRLTLLLLSLILVFPLFAQVDYFTLEVDSLFGLWNSESDWGDFDNDNDLDLMMVGYGLGGATGEGFHKFYRNDGNSVFTLVNTGMMGVGNGCARFADLDGDNDLDAVIAGQYLFSVDSTRVYINNGGTFTDSGANLPPRVSNSISFADYDNDGDLDILMTGGTIDDSAVGYLEIYRNEGNFNFTQINVMTPGVRNGCAEFGDYNNDGWQDIAVAGSAGSGNYITKILKGSSSGIFTELPLTLLGLRYSKITWADYDCDGDLDVLLSGSFVNESPSVFKLYRNDGNDQFVDLTQPYVLGERQGDLTCGDVNSDGYPDIILNGLITNTTTVANVYLYNPQSTYFEDAQTMIYLKYACMSLGDYNGDNRLDMSLSGHYDYQDYWNELYYNSSTVANNAPIAPTGLNATVTRNDVLLYWDAASDDHTPALGLSYNLRVGTSPGGNDIISSMAVPSTGWRKIARPGNAGNRLFYTLNGLSNGTYYWSVQAIDASFTGGAFAAESIFWVGVANDDNVSVPISEIGVYPNPFSTQSTICFELKKPGNTRVEIFNLKGQLVKTLLHARMDMGTQNLNWDGNDDQSRPVTNGIYSIRVENNNQIETKKIMLIK
jgi:hypothetical protein